MHLSGNESLISFFDRKKAICNRVKIRRLLRSVAVEYWKKVLPSLDVQHLSGIVPYHFHAGVP